MNTTLSSIIKKGIKPLKSSDTIDKALSILHHNSISSVVITDAYNKPLGIFTEHDSLKIISKKIDKNLNIASVMSKNVFYIKEDVFLHDAYMQMEEHGFKHIIVVDKNDNYIGVLSEGDFIRYLGFEGLKETKPIKELMNSFMLTISKDTLLEDVTKLMTKHKQDYAIIVENNIPKSIISERDVTYYCLNKDLAKQTKASELTRENNFNSIDIDTPIQDAAHMMENHGVHRVLVTNNNELVGIITRHDVLKAINGAYYDFLIRTIENKNMKEELLQAQKHHLWLIANHDQLTNLPNRYQLRDYIEESIIDKKTDSLALVLIDLKKFKDINDSYGQDIGDEVLNIVAKKLQQFLDDNSMVARLGNNEFAIAINNLNNNFETIVNNIIDELSKSSKLSNTSSISLSVSLGVAIYPDHTNNSKDLMQHAGTALHEAKKENLSSLKFYDAEMTKNIQKKISCELRLKDAIKNKELELYFQPQVHIQTGNIVGAEALIRWNDNLNGLTSPDTFIPIAEESGLINQIGEWVIQEACKFGKKCLNNHHRLTIALNVSANQIKYQNISQIISDALESSGFEADKLEIEITESSIMHRAEENIKKLHSIRALGVRIAVDDFGTGYSSLSYLKRFPIDVLKIDKSFIDDIPYSKDDMAIVIAIIEMGKALGYEILAEGIETKEQLEFLKEKQCSLYQGFYKSEPLRAEEFEKLLFKESQALH